jgi:hypothetical protein
LPVLVSRLPDRAELARLLRAVLRHEVAHVALAEAPRVDAVHALELQISGLAPLSVLAEPAGNPREGRFPLRLSPRGPAQAAALERLIATSPEPAPAAAVPPRPAQDDLDDPKKTAPSASWAPGPVASRRPSARTWEGPVQRDGGDDPKKTVRSASWAPISEPYSDPAGEASLDIPVVFEPEDDDALSTVPPPLAVPGPGGADVDEAASTLRPDPFLGRRIAQGAYRLEARIGEGAVGAVYRAAHRSFARSLAVEVFHSRGDEHRPFLDRMRSEARQDARLAEPGVPRVLHVGQEADGLCYVVTELPRGAT